MKIILALVSCLLVGTTTAQTWIAGIPVRRASSRGGRALVTQAICDASNRFQSFCDNEDPCASKNAFICNGVGKSIPIPCGEDSYCVTANGEGECTDTRPDGCGSAPADFECTGEGFYPDPFDCHKFYQCVADDTGDVIAEKLECPAPYVFDPSGPKNQFCRLTNGHPAYCSKVKCNSDAKSENILMRFSWFPASLGQYVVTCIKGSSPIVTRCPPGLLANLTPLVPKCELVCSRAATAAYPFDVTRFYECVYNTATRRWESKLQTCYKNFFFDEKLKMCVKAPACTNGANNAPKCNACSGNKAFVDGSCTDCGAQILDTTSGTCVDCPTGAAYDVAFKGCACTTGTEAIDTTANACKTCPALAPIDTVKKACVCTSGATNPFDTDTTKVCKTCPPGQELNSATTKCAAV